MFKIIHYPIIIDKCKDTISAEEIGTRAYIMRSWLPNGYSLIVSPFKFKMCQNNKQKILYWIVDKNFKLDTFLLQSWLSVIKQNVPKDIIVEHILDIDDILGDELSEIIQLEFKNYKEDEFKAFIYIDS